MRLHAIFPQTEIGSDPAVIARFIRDIEAMGFDGLVAYDHVLGADPARPGWSGPYTIESQFHEVMVLFAFAAAITTRLELSTGVLILPQRQTALVAKQAAAVDLLPSQPPLTGLRRSVESAPSQPPRHVSDWGQIRPAQQRVTVVPVEPLQPVTVGPTQALSRPQLHATSVHSVRGDTRSDT